MREGRGKKGAKWIEKVGKGEGGLDLDICPAPPPAPRVPSYATVSDHLTFLWLDLLAWFAGSWSVFERT